MALDSRNKFKDLFCAEVEDRLDVLSRTLLLLENDPGNATYYETLMRSAHTIKGGAATMGYTGMAQLAHTLEDVFHAGERGVLVLTKEAVSAIFSAMDQMRHSLEAIKNDTGELPVEETTKILFKILSGDENRGSAQRKKSEQNPIVTFLIVLVLIYLAVRHPWLLLFLGGSGRSGGSSGGFGGGGGFGGFGGGSSGGGGGSSSW